MLSVRAFPFSEELFDTFFLFARLCNGHIILNTDTSGQKHLVCTPTSKVHTMLAHRKSISMQHKTPSSKPFTSFAQLYGSSEDIRSAGVESSDDLHPLSASDGAPEKEEHSVLASDALISKLKANRTPRINTNSTDTTAHTKKRKFSDQRYVVAFYKQ